MPQIETSYTEYFNSLLEFHKETDNSDLSESYLEEQCTFLVDQDVLQSFHIIKYNNSSKNCRVDAWGLKPAVDNSLEGNLVLIISDFRDSETIVSQTLSAFRNYIEKGKRFFLNSLKDLFRLDELRKENDDVKALADFIYLNRNSIYDITIVGLTNTIISSRSNTLVISEISNSDFLFHYDVWDFDRCQKIWASQKGRESIDIDFVDDYGLANGIKALTADIKAADMMSFLFVLPGEVLYTMYEQWNERLLEQNPRTFLQFTGKVNKGIRRTLVNEPERFFCYNNGITAVASGVDYDVSNGNLLCIRNFQIVNGGQTTASIFNSARKAKKRKEEFHLEKVFVMVKMTVVENEDIAKDLIPSISEYSNTQNKVSSSAFSIHHVYHKKMEEFSRNIWTPVVGGIETHWYYERVLGQYKNAINLCRTPGEKSLFEKQNPKMQMYKTVDLAKYIFAFDKHPDVVCLGAQKCYAAFCKTYLGGDKESEEKQINDGSLNESLFKENCMKAMIFKALEKRQGNGVRFVSVPYIIACIIVNLEQRNLYFDLQSLWKNQLNNELPDLLASFDKTVIDKITETMPLGTAILSEWAKKPDCWRQLQFLRLDTRCLEPYCLNKDMYDEQKTDNKRSTKEIGEVEAQIYVFEKGIPYWKTIREFVSNKGIKVDTIQSSILNQLISGKIISGKQSKLLVKLENTIIKEGFC